MEEKQFLEYGLYEVVTDVNGVVYEADGTEVVKLIAGFVFQSDAEDFAKAVYVDDTCYRIVKF